MLYILLSDEHFEYLESIIPFNLGFPSSMIIGVCLLPNIPQVHNFTFMMLNLILVYGKHRFYRLQFIVIYSTENE